MATAEAYLEQVTSSFLDYLRLYKKSWLKLQQTSLQTLDGLPRREKMYQRALKGYEKA